MWSNGSIDMLGFKKEKLKIVGKIEEFEFLWSEIDASRIETN